MPTSNRGNPKKIAENALAKSIEELLKEDDWKEIDWLPPDFSKKLTDQLGENIPLDTERGYHVHFKNKDKLIKRPVIFLDRGLFVFVLFRFIH